MFCGSCWVPQGTCGQGLSSPAITLRARPRVPRVPPLTLRPSHPGPAPHAPPLTPGPAHHTGSYPSRSVPLTPGSRPSRSTPLTPGPAPHGRRPSHLVLTPQAPRSHLGPAPQVPRCNRKPGRGLFRVASPARAPVLILLLSGFYEPDSQQQKHFLQGKGLLLLLRQIN